MADLERELREALEAPEKPGHHKVYVVEGGEVEVSYVPDDLFPPVEKCKNCGMDEDMCICDVEIPDAADTCADCAHRYDEHKGCAWIDTARCEGGFWGCGCERFRRPTDPSTGEDEDAC